MSINFNLPRVATYYMVLPQTNYRNDGPAMFVTAAFRNILNGKVDMGDGDGNVVHLWPGQHNDKFGKFDLNIMADWGEDALGVPLDWEIPHPSAYWVSDAHINEKAYSYRMNRAKQFDFVFVCQEAFIDQFVADGIPREKIFFLPHCVEPSCYKPFPIIERWDWCFIGHMNNDFRIDLVDRFCKEWTIGEKGYLGWRFPEIPGHNVLEDAAKKFCQSRIVLNENIKEDINMRTFEALACKRPLLTEGIAPLSKLFKDKVHLRTYKTIDEAVSIAYELLADPVQRLMIAKAGHEEVMSKHTYKHRAMEMLKTCINWTPTEELTHAH